MILFMYMLGFTKNVWDFYLGFLFLMPAFLWISYRVLRYYRLDETYHFSYFLNVFLLFNALSQQVTNTLHHRAPLGSFTGLWTRAELSEHEDHLYHHVPVECRHIWNLLCLIHLHTIWWDIVMTLLSPEMSSLFAVQLLKWENHLPTSASWTSLALKLEDLTREQQKQSSRWESRGSRGDWPDLL